MGGGHGVLSLAGVSSLAGGSVKGSSEREGGAVKGCHKRSGVMKEPHLLGQQGGGMHPTGMHSYFNLIMNTEIYQSNDCTVFIVYHFVGKKKCPKV